MVLYTAQSRVIMSIEHIYQLPLQRDRPFPRFLDLLRPMPAVLCHAYINEDLIVACRRPRRKFCLFVSRSLSDKGHHEWNPFSKNRYFLRYRIWSISHLVNIPFHSFDATPYKQYIRLFRGTSSLKIAIEDKLPTRGTGARDLTIVLNFLRILPVVSS